MTRLTPYLFFSGRCEEAISFYMSHLGAEQLFLMRFNDSPDATPPGMLAPGFETKVMHSTVRIGETIVMMSDGCDAETKFSGFRISIALPTEADAQRVFAALSQGGTVEMPLTKTFWSSCFGMLTDQFGIGWMVTLEEETSAPQ